MGGAPLSDDQLREIVRQLARRPGHESLRADIREILVSHLGVPLDEIRLEANMAQVRGRADALLARTVLEFKSDMRNELDDAERQLATYLLDCEHTTGLRFVGVATDGVDYRAYELRRGKLVPLRSQFNLRSSLREHRDNAAEAGHALAAWLGSFLTLRPELRPEPAIIRIELGRESVAFEIAGSVVPRMLFVVQRADAGRFRASPDAPVVESRRTTLEKLPWKNLEPLRKPVEKEFVRPRYLGESLAPFRLLAPVDAVIPWDNKVAALLDSGAAQSSGYKYLAAWLAERRKNCGRSMGETV